MHAHLQPAGSAGPELPAQTSPSNVGVPVAVAELTMVVAASLKMFFLASSRLLHTRVGPSLPRHMMVAVIWVSFLWCFFSSSAIFLVKWMWWLRPWVGLGRKGPE